MYVERNKPLATSLHKLDSDLHGGLQPGSVTEARDLERPFFKFTLVMLGGEGRGREGLRGKGGREGRREGGREEGRKGGEEGREGGREEGREGGREEGKEGGKEREVEWRRKRWRRR